MARAEVGWDVGREWGGEEWHGASVRRGETRTGTSMW
jgi:hypothetical protein